MTSLENLTVFYNSTELNGMYRAVLRIMLSNLHQVGNLNIYELAELCYTSPATISRLVRKIGYKNYTQFQSEVSACVSRYEHHNRFVQSFDTAHVDPAESVLTAFEELYSEFKASLDIGEIDSIAAALHKASRVVLFPYGVLFSENFLQSDLFMSGIPCDIFIGDCFQAEAASEMCAGELAVIFCPECIDSLGPLKTLIGIIKEKGAGLCVISGSTNRQLKLDKDDFFVPIKGRRSMLDTYIMELYLALIDIRFRSQYMDR